MKQLIPISYLNESCFLSLNTDSKKYSMVLKMAQEDLKEILGSTFYDEIETQYPSSLSTDNKSLYDESKDFLAWQTYFYYLKFANSDATPSGIREHNDENSSIVTDVKMYSLEKNVRERAMKYKGDIINFLKLERQKDSTKYPLWEDRCDNYGLSFAFTSITKNDYSLIQVNKTMTTNE